MCTHGTMLAAACRMQVDRVTIQHLAEHFVNHARSANIGAIATAWLVHADR